MSVGALIVRAIVVVVELPFNAAVTVTDWLLVNEPDVAVKFAVLPPAATVTDVGVVRVALVSEMATIEPPAGADWFRVTVQVLEAFWDRVAGVQTSEETCTGAIRLTLVLAVLLLYVAVTVAV